MMIIEGLDAIYSSREDWLPCTRLGASTNSHYNVGACVSMAA